MAALRDQQHLQLICLEGDPRQYVVDIGVGQLSRVPEVLRGVVPQTRQVAVISDTTVWRLWGSAFRQCFSDAGLPFHLKLVLPGEQSKCRSVKAEVEDWMVRSGCTRRTMVVAFGGGVVGDLAGFVAATYMRGVPFIQVPTTLLAMVDSSVGGKTAIDTPGGKNLVGAFHQPRAVLVDPALLATLPQRQVNAGMAEVVKAGFIRDEELLAACEALAPAVARKDPAALGRLVAAALRVKLAVVQEDEREAGLRAVLNCGHTVGHGVEALLAPAWLHGECVAVGMLREAEAARAMGVLADVHVQRLLRCLRDYALPTAEPPGLDVAAAIDKMAADKKNSVGGVAAAARSVQCVLVCAPGRVLQSQGGGWTHSVPTHLLRRLMTRPVQIQTAPVALNGSTRAVPVQPALPGSKSLTNRLLLLAALATGRTELRGVLLSDDTNAMLAALRCLGVRWELVAAERGAVAVAVDGCAGSLQWPLERGSGSLFVKNAGTASRFLAAALCLLPAAVGRSLLLDGNERMRQRPIAPLVSALQAQGASVEWAGERAGSLPLRLGGGGLRGGSLRMSGRVSSQFVSALLMAAPFAREPLRLQLEEEQPTSLPYIEMTIAAMAQFGVVVERPATNAFLVPVGGYSSAGAVLVEPDASAASYPASIAAVTDRPVVLLGIRADCLQGDASYAAHLAAMGCVVSQEEGGTTVCPPPAGQLRAIELDMADTTDTFLSLAAVAPFTAPGSTTVITGVANQRVKECNRIAAMVAGLRAAGVVARERVDGLEVDSLGWEPCTPAQAQAQAQAAAGTPAAEESPEVPVVTIECHDDHRMAMAFAVLALGIEHRRRAGVAGAQLAPRLALDDCRCVEKTFPSFWDMLTRDFGVTLAAGQQSTAGDEGSLAHLPPAQQLLARSAGRRVEAAGALRVLIVVGMRGVGKTTLARLAARRLGWRFRDTDHALQAAAGASCAELVAQRGWPGFRAMELDTLRSELAAALDGGSAGVVLACGGGVVETPAARRTLLSAGARSEAHVVWIDRWIGDIERDLGIDRSEEGLAEAAGEQADAQRPAYAGGDSLRAVWKRRLPWFEEVATTCFAVPAGVPWAAVERGFLGHIRRLGALSDHGRRLAAAMRRHGCPAAVQSMVSPVARPVACVAPRSCFVCSTAPDLVTSAPAQAALETAAAEGIADCVELRLDLLGNPSLGAEAADSASDDGSHRCWRRVVKEAVATAQRCAGDLPVLATLRSTSEGGAFSGSPALAAAVLVQAAIAGAQLVDVEVDWLQAARPASPDGSCSAAEPCGQSPLEVLLAALQSMRPAPLVVASKHFAEPAPHRSHPDRSTWEGRVSGALAQLVRCGVPAHRLVVKLVVAAGAASDCAWLANRVAQAEEEWDRAACSPLACVALAMGPAGQLSRVTNRAFTPVTHPALPAAAAPGQLSAEGVRLARQAVGLEQPAAFALFGSPIQLSASPAMHNAAFHALGLPWAYKLTDTADQAVVAQSLSSGGVVGGSVTIPHKEAVAPLCAGGLCPAAAALGAVNTLVPTPGGLTGHNTDWIGIAAPLAQLLAPRRPGGPGSALVVGAGGTARAAAFAAVQLGLLPVICNPRTPAKGQALASSLAASWGVAVSAVASPEEVAGPVAAILSTLPGSAGFAAPARLLESRPVVLEAAYMPRRTTLLAQAEAAGCTVVAGLEMLVQQGLAQSALWTGLPAVQRTIAEAAHLHYMTVVEEG